MLVASHLPLTHDGVRLRPLAHRDATAYAEGTEDGAVRTYAHLPAPQYTPASVAEMIDGAVREGLERGDLAVLAIAHATTDDFTGSAVLFDVTGEAAEVGFWMHPAWRGGGRASAGLHLAALLAGRSGLSSLTARTVTDNHASQHVLTRAGFAQTHRGLGTTPAGHTAELLHYERRLATD